MIIVEEIVEEISGWIRQKPKCVDDPKTPDRGLQS